MKRTNLSPQRQPVPCRGATGIFAVCALATAGAAPAGDLSLLAPNLAAPVTQSENAVTAKTCAAMGVICLPLSLQEEGDPEMCTSECLDDEHCSEDYFWPPSFECVNTASGLRCMYVPPS